MLLSLLSLCFSGCGHDATLNDADNENVDSDCKPLSGDEDPSNEKIDTVSPYGDVDLFDGDPSDINSDEDNDENKDHENNDADVDDGEGELHVCAPERCNNHGVCRLDNGIQVCDCYEGFHREENTRCISDFRKVPCINELPEHAVWSEINKEGFIDQVWYQGLWSPEPTTCRWECADGYVKKEALGKCVWGWTAKIISKDATISSTFQSISSNGERVSFATYINGGCNEFSNYDSTYPAFCNYSIPQFLSITTTDRAGNFINQHRISGDAIKYRNSNADIAYDGEDLYVTGNISNDLNEKRKFFLDNIEFAELEAKGRAGYVVKIASDGSLAWSWHLPGNWDRGVNFQNVQVVSDGIVATGVMGGSITIDDKVYTSNGLYDGFAIKFSRDGKVVAVRRFGGTKNEGFKDAVADGEDIWIVGEFNSDEMIVGDDPDSMKIVYEGGSYNGYLLKLDKNLDPVVLIGSRGAGWESMQQIEKLQDGVVVLTVYSKIFHMGDTVVEAFGEHREYALFYYSEKDGAVKWIRKIGATSALNKPSLAVSDDRLFVSFFVNKNKEFDILFNPESGIAQEKTKGVYNSYIISYKIGEDLAFDWSKRLHMEKNSFGIKKVYWNKGLYYGGFANYYKSKDGSFDEQLIFAEEPYFDSVVKKYDEWLLFFGRLSEKDGSYIR